MFNFTYLNQKMKASTIFLTCLMSGYGLTHSSHAFANAHENPLSQMSSAEKNKLKLLMIEKAKSMKSNKMTPSFPQLKTKPEKIYINDINQSIPELESSENFESIINEPGISFADDSTVSEVNNVEQLSQEPNNSNQENLDLEQIDSDKSQKNLSSKRKRFIDAPFNINTDNDALVAVGLGGHRIKGGEAWGMYLSGIVPIGESKWGVYGRGELIKDEYKTGPFWSWKMAVGPGYYFNENLIGLLNVGKCFSNYSTCYFNLRHPTANDDDIDAIYYGIGAFMKAPVIDGMIEISLDWSPYKSYNGSSLYLGYAFRFK